MNTTTAAVTMERYQMFVGGQWVDAHGGRTRDTVDPYSGEAWAVVPEAGIEDVERVVAAARSAFDDGPWPRLSGKERGRLLRRLADLVRENAGALARIETRDNGKLLREMSGQLQVVPDEEQDLVNLLPHRNPLRRRLLNRLGEIRELLCDGRRAINLLERAPHDVGRSLQQVLRRLPNEDAILRI